MANSRFAGGGAARVSSFLAKGLAGHSSINFRTFSNECPSLINRFSRVIDRVPSFIAGKRKGEVWSNSRSTINSNFKRVLLEFNPDVLHLNWINDGLININELSSFKGKIIWTLHDLWPLTGGCHIPYHCRQFSRDCSYCPLLKDSRLAQDNLARKNEIFRALDITWVVPSLFMKELALKSGLVEEDAIQVIHNASDFSAEGSKPKSPERPTILFGANNWDRDKNKGLDIAIAALKKVHSWGKNFELQLFGQCQNSQLETPFPTQYLGNLSTAELREKMASAQLVLIPSLFESFSLLSIEAQTMGTPVVTFSGHGTEETVAHQRSGFIVRNPSIESYAEGIDYCLSYIDNFEEGCQSWVSKNFSLDKMIGEYEELYLSLRP